MSKRLRRRQNVRPLKPTYLIVCEGTSEEMYFKGLKRHEKLKNINIKVLNPSRSTPNEIFSYARKELKVREYDAVFCVIDGDVIKGGDAGKSFAGKGIAAVISGPCFELWFLLHFKYTNREFHNCGELISTELLKYIPDYEKSKDYQSKKSFYAFLRESMETAVSNARKLDAENTKNGKVRGRGTSTGIYKLLVKILRY